MKSKAILILLAVVAATMVAAILHRPTTGAASKIVYVIAPARSDFQHIVQSDPRYSMLKATPIGRSGRVRVTATDTISGLAQSNLDAAIRSLIDWGFDWQEMRTSKEELAVVHLAGAVQDYDPRDRPGKWSNMLNHIYGSLRDTVSP